ncbi:hypothetical protein BH747_06670 [Enterococcus villorum]|uniref:Uncharacterized protein n=1 Tax=Enterococcus villorum TaxID=112904 RepID=A0A1V8YX02_9ENTE|nr:hypothetical protein [Enterococcus villorum]OQO70381.1 hypothetical protein BH747_06670 [Enterococcus villorum]OQO77165.1 hypothetical protein BH744_00365 [Enterococcus villorum]
MSFFKIRFVYLTITFVLFEIISRLFLGNVNIFIRYGLFLLLALLIDYLFRLFDQYPNKRNE